MANGVNNTPVRFTADHIPPSERAQKPAASASEHRVVPDFLRFKHLRLHDRLNHLPQFGAAIARTARKLGLAPQPEAPCHPDDLRIGRSRSNSLPKTPRGPMLDPAIEAKSAMHERENAAPAEHPGEVSGTNTDVATRDQ